jgi:hypothetical protein
MSNCKGIYLDCRGTAAALVGEEPPLNMGWSERNIFAADTTDLHPANAAAEGILYSVSSSYLAHCRDSVVDRPGFHRARQQSGPPVAIVNEHFARKLFGSPQDALGRSFKARDGVRRQIVGVVEDGKYTANIAEDPRLAMFFPIVQAPSPATWLVVRSDRDPQEMGGAIRQLVHNIDPGLPVFVQTWQKEMNGALFASRMAAISLGVLGIMGAMLSITGVFGMAAYSVSRRMRELGIRLALGAQWKEVLQAALGPRSDSWQSDRSPDSSWVFSPAAYCPRSFIRRRRAIASCSQVLWAPCCCSDSWQRPSRHDVHCP